MQLSGSLPPTRSHETFPRGGPWPPVLFDYKSLQPPTAISRHLCRARLYRDPGSSPLLQDTGIPAGAMPLPSNSPGLRISVLGRP